MSAPSDSQSLITTSRIPPALGGLTLKQSKFLDYFLTDPDIMGNGTKSVIAAGYTDDPASAAVIASQLLRSLKVKQELKRRLGTAIASPSEILERLTKQARADITDLLNKNGEFDLKRAKQKRLLKKLKIKTRTDALGVTTTEHEFEIHDPQSADDKLGKFHRLFSEKADPEPVDPRNLAREIVAVLREAVETHRRESAIEVEAISGEE